jgi:hypothetical protein
MPATFDGFVQSVGSTVSTPVKKARHRLHVAMDNDAFVAGILKEPSRNMQLRSRAALIGPGVGHERTCGNKGSGAKFASSVFHVFCLLLVLVAVSRKVPVKSDFSVSTSAAWLMDL